jgi:hypothetical protein
MYICINYDHIILHTLLCFYIIFIICIIIIENVPQSNNNLGMNNKWQEYHTKHEGWKSYSEILQHIRNMKNNAIWELLEQNV